MIVVVPMAGRGSRFANNGYTTPKPFIEVLGQPMFIRALKSIEQVQYSKIVFVALKEHDEEYKLHLTLKQNNMERAEVVCIDEVTEGQLCTVLAARKYFENGEDLLIMASDSYIASGIQADISNKSSDCKGIISVINLPGEQWSFAKTNELGDVTEVAEKVRISDHASTGIYYFADGKEFCATADAIIAGNERTRGEFYVIPVYQKMIDRGEKVTLSHAQEMWDMGTPDAKEKFENYLRKDAR